MSDILETSREGRVLRVRLNRPEKRNALSADLCARLAQVLEDAAGERATGAILLTGNGKSFCAGMDLDEIGATDSEAISQAHERLFTIGARLTVPIVGAVNGAALGGGMGLVANCHIVVASPEARFGLTEIRLGLWPFLIYRAVVSALGERRALELALTGRIFGAAEALQMGLIHETAPDADGRAAEIAASIAGSSPAAVRSGMELVRESRGRTWVEAGAVARRLRDQILEGPDLREGIAAFREKRQPKWASAKPK